MDLPPVDLPVRLVIAGKVSIPLEIFEKQGQVHAIGEAQRLAVDSGAASDEDLVVPAGQEDGVFQGGRHLDSGRCVRRLRCENDGNPARQRSADGLEGLSPHDQMVAHGQPLESPPIVREPPGQPIVAADDAVVGHGRDDGQPHTDMGALMWGWGS